jgi:hypothetical protein
MRRRSFLKAGGVTAQVESFSFSTLKRKLVEANNW